METDQSWSVLQCCRGCMVEFMAASWNKLLNKPCVRDALHLVQITPLPIPHLTPRLREKKTAAHLSSNNRVQESKRGNNDFIQLNYSESMTHQGSPRCGQHFPSMKFLNVFVLDDLLILIKECIWSSINKTIINISMYEAFFLPG